jgi:hypothetical protein
MHHDETRWMTTAIELWCLVAAIAFAALQSTQPTQHSTHTPMPPTTHSHPPPSPLRRALAVLRPGRITTLACAIVFALATAGVD